MGLPVIITTTGSSFSPWVQTASTAITVTWTCPSASITTTGTTPTLSFGSAGTRQVYMTAADANGYEAIDQVTLFNLGYSYSVDDTGTYSLPAAYNWTSQSVSAVSGIHWMEGLKYFAAASIGGLQGELDFTGLSNLLNIECYNSGLDSVNLTGCENLQRLVVEANNLTEIDINPVAASIREVRCAFQNGGALDILPLSNSFFAVDYHFCTRDQILTGLPNLATTLPAVDQLWIWNTRQSGSLAPVSSSLNSLLAHSNNYTSATLTNQMTSASGEVNLAANSLATCDLTGCTGLTSIYLADNNFSQSEVNTILGVVDGFSTSGGILDLGGNPSPSGTGITHASNLTGRSWTVTTGAGSVSVVQYATASGGASVSFTNPVTAGNTVIYIVGAYSATNSPASSSAPTLNSAAVTGSSAAFNPTGTCGINSPWDTDYAALVYVTAWMLPDCPAHNGLDLTVSGVSGVSGAIAYEVAGLGVSPVWHRAGSGAAAYTTAVDPGQMGETTIAPTIALGFAQVYNSLSAGPGAPWTNTSAGTHVWAGYRFLNQSGGGESVNWLPTASGGNGPWAAGIVAVGA